MTINTYLTFKDNCRAAFEFYRSVFGGEFLFMQTFADGPADMGVPEDKRDLIMHVTLPVGAGVLMGSDSAGFGPDIASGNNFALSLSPDSREQADELFAKLSAGRHRGDADAGNVLGLLLRFLQRPVRHQVADQPRIAAGLSRARPTLSSCRDRRRRAGRRRRS